MGTTFGETYDTKLKSKCARHVLDTWELAGI
jgi:hypothetical protein